MLNVNKNFTLDELKNNYKKLAIKYHPDKGGSEEVFNVLTDCFKHLYKEHKAKQSDKQFYELKKHASHNIESYNNNYDDNFNKKFNDLFDKNRLKDPIFDKGYTDEMVEERLKKKNNELTKYIEPVACQITKNLNFFELGYDSVEDYSGDTDGKKLHYTDYLKAHTTTEIIKPDEVKERENYKSLDDIKIKREKADFTMTDEEKYYYEQMKNNEKNKEDNRVKTLKKLDNMWEQHHYKVNNLLKN